VVESFFYEMYLLLSPNFEDDKLEKFQRLEFVLNSGTFYIELVAGLTISDFNTDSECS
jgi:hypothetical protein